MWLCELHGGHVHVIRRVEALSIHNVPIHGAGEVPLICHNLLGTPSNQTNGAFSTLKSEVTD